MLHLQHVVRTTDKGKMEELLHNHFTDTIFYQIELTAKYCKMLGTQLFEKYNIELSEDEFVILDTILCNPGVCQRDLAKLIMRDRANTGKLLDSLEAKGYIARKLDIKNNRPVKIAELTESGIAKTKEITAVVKPHIESAKNKIQNTDLERIKGLLKEFREVLNQTVEIKI